MSAKELTDLPRPPVFKAGYETYQSPLTYRYGSDEMRRIWSQEAFWLRVRDIWIAVAEVQSEVGLVTKEQVADLKVHRDQISVERIFQFERDRVVGTGHDVAAAIAEFSEVAPLGGRILHQGLTSEDVLSNAEMMQIRDSFVLIRGNLIDLLKAWGGQIARHKGLVCIGATHLQIAEPTTMGYRFSRYTQNLFEDLRELDSSFPTLKGKGIKGPVGTSAALTKLLRGKGMSAYEHERKVMAKLGIDAVPIAGQTYPRKELFTTEVVLSGIGQTLHQFAFDLQFLQSSYVDEVAEPRRKGQVGSSAMPHKQNPINAENIDSLTEVLPGALFSAWMTEAFVTLERTLRDSAGKRIWLPESFLIVDEALIRAERVVVGLVVHENSVANNLRKFAPFCVTEVILADLTEAGMDRKEAHEILVEHAEAAVDTVRNGQPNPMRDLIMGDQRILGILGKKVVEKAFKEIYSHIGVASRKAAAMVRKIAAL
ncbi:adenylosuccinate lyase [Candidatus Daviesbacteria bacterium]|nr:adenylosuccinate lyase [Candidatus Daviesbacteria bacterium]